MTDERIKQIMISLGQPNSTSLYQAINQIINETQLDMLRKPFSSLNQIFVHCGIKFKVTDQVNCLPHLSHQREIGIYDEQESQIITHLYFNIKDNDTEEFVCQE